MTNNVTVNINLSCLNLPSQLLEGVRIVVSTLREDGFGTVEIGQTESVVGNVNPVFERVISVVVRFDLNQILTLTLYRIDPQTDALLYKCGDVELSLFTMISNPGQISFPMRVCAPELARQSQHALPLFVASATPIDELDRTTALRFVGDGLLASGHSQQTAPYFTMELVPSVNEKMPILLYRSEVAYGHESPRWREFCLPTGFFPSTSDWSLQISCYNFTNNHEDFLHGRFVTTFYQLLNNKHGTNKFLLRRGSKRKDACIELVSVRSCENVPSLVRSLKSGLQMHFTLAVDFTMNNGGPNDADSLHFIHPYNGNAYMNVLSELSPALMKFDKLGRISMLGFGAKVPPKFEVSQLFALNGDLNNSHVKELPNIIQNYRNAAITLLPYAPTEYSGVIHHVVKMAKAAMRSTAGFYFVLVILTNGAIRDNRDTIDTIVQASELPVSIVFVTIGNTKHPVGLNGDVSNLTHLLSPTLKSSKNMPLRRETVSLAMLNNHDAAFSSAEMVSPLIAQRIFGSLQHCFSRDLVGPLRRVEGKMNAIQYREVLEEAMLPHTTDEMAAGWVFQHENDSKHKKGSFEHLWEELE